MEPELEGHDNSVKMPSETSAQILYRDAGDWARHFSCVRLSLALVLVLGGAITTITAGHLPAALRVGIFAWITGIVSFVYFTWLVIKMQNRQRKIRAELLHAQADWESRSLWTDVPLWLGFLFSVGAMLCL